MYRIEAVLQALKTRLNDDGEMQVQSMNGYMYQGLFTFHPPALEEQIDDLKKSFGEDLPADYVAFLRLHNGMEMFGSKQYGGAIRFYSAQECIAQHAVFKDIYESYGDEYGSCVPIGDFPDRGFIALDMKRCKEKGASYIRIFDILPKLIPGTFEQFIDRLVVSQGSAYWEWVI